jgi:RNA polymerase sigma factor (sigma-70 family)
VTPSVADLYSRYGAMVYRRALRFFGPEEAEDVVQEIFIKVMRQIDGFRGESSHCLKRLSKNARRQELWADHRLEMDAPGVLGPNQEAVTLLGQIWRELSEEQATLGVYRYGDGMTLEAIAQVSGLSRKTVQKRLGELDRTLRRVTGG